MTYNHEGGTSVLIKISLNAYFEHNLVVSTRDSLEVFIPGQQRDHIGQSDTGLPPQQLYHCHSCGPYEAPRGICIEIVIP